MYKRDYILQLIEQTALVLHKVMFARKNAQFEQAMALLNQAMKQLLGLNSKLIQALAVKDLIALLSKDGEVDQGKVLAAGDLLNAEAALLKETGNETAARKAALKSAELLLTARELDARAELKEQFHERVDAALDVAGRVSTGIDLLEKLFLYYEEAAKFAGAEDTLFYLLDELKETGDRDRHGNVLDEGIRMYERWLLLDEATLIEGGFSKVEVASGLEALQKMKAE